MYTSKSLIDSITVGKLEFDCTNIVAWLKANGGNYSVDYDEILNLPIEVMERFGPVSKLSSGCYGGVYKLMGYPGLVLKVCFDPRDGYPEYIRSVAAKRAPKWAPVIFAHGGDETDGGFWCVMPAYEETRDYPAPCPYPTEAVHLMNAAGYYGWKAEYRANAFVRTHRSDIETTLSAMHAAGAGEDCHSGNVMYDPVRKHHVITDPIARWEKADKEAYRAAHS